MKNICTDNTGYEELLTVGREYRVINENIKGKFKVVADNLELLYVPQSRFSDSQYGDKEVWVESKENHFAGLTYGKKYKVIKETDLNYWIDDDFHKNSAWDKDYFNTIVPAPSAKKIICWKKEGYTVGGFGNGRWKIADSIGNTEILPEKWMSSFGFDPIYEAPIQYKELKLGNPLTDFRVWKDKVEVKGCSGVWQSDAYRHFPTYPRGRNTGG